MRNTIKGVVRRLVLPLLCAATVPFLPGSARADNTNWMHANLCSSKDDNATFSAAGLTHTGTGTTLGVFCPVLITDTASMSNATGRVRGWDNDTSGFAFVCRGVVRNNNSDVIMFAGDAQGPITPAGYTGVVNIPAGGGNGVLAFAPVVITSSHAIDINCDIPPASQIFNVRVDN